MHANQNCALPILAHDEIHRRFHAPNNILRAFTTLDPKRRISLLPLVQHVMVIFVFLNRDAMALFGAPAYFVESDQGGMLNPQIEELLYRLLAPLQGRRIDMVERNVLISSKKRARLLSSHLVEIGVHATALDDILQIKIRLPVPDQVNFFAVQFSAILRPLLRCVAKQAQK